MPTKILITVNRTKLEGMLYDTPCAQAIAQKLPFAERPQEWGDEFYFEVPVTCAADATASTKVKVGDIAYWPQGKALVIFFGRTPMSTGPDPVPAGPVNSIGRIIGDATVLVKEKGCRKIRIEKAE